MISQNYATYVFQCPLRNGLITFGALALTFASKDGLQAYNNTRKDQLSLFVFHFQVDGSVFLFGTKVNDDSNFYPMY